LRARSAVAYRRYKIPHVGHREFPAGIRGFMRVEHPNMRFYAVRYAVLRGMKTGVEPRKVG
jgi:hypothetical protein